VTISRLRSDDMMKRQRNRNSTLQIYLPPMGKGGSGNCWKMGKNEMDKLYCGVDYGMDRLSQID